MTLDALLEAILFAAASPVGVQKLANLSEHPTDEVEEALKTLGNRLKESGSGLQLARAGKEVELVTVGEAAEAVAKAGAQEIQGELTRPSLEALTILAYRGPMTRPEIEQIRGVQSALILRNLMLRGLVEQREETRLGQPMYAVTLDFLKHLGIADVSELPDYESLRSHSAVDQVLKELEAPEAPPENE